MKERTGTRGKENGKRKEGRKGHYYNGFNGKNEIRRRRRERVTKWKGKVEQSERISISRGRRGRSGEGIEIERKGKER